RARARPGGARAWSGPEREGDREDDPRARPAREAVRPRLLGPGRAADLRLAREDELPAPLPARGGGRRRPVQATCLVLPTELARRGGLATGACESARLARSRAVEGRGEDVLDGVCEDELDRLARLGRELREVGLVLVRDDHALQPGALRGERLLPHAADR